MIEVKRGVYATQARCCWGCLQVGMTAVYLGFMPRRDYGWRLELFTPLHRFRWGRGRWTT